MPVPSVDSNKAAFLARVRGALGRAEPTTVVPDYAPLKATLPRHQEKILTLKARLEARAEASKHTLIQNARNGSWNIHLPESNEATARIIAEIASGARARNVVRTADDIFKRVNIDEELRRLGKPPTVLASNRSRRKTDLKRIAFKSDFGVCGIDYVIAETASCVIIPRRGVARMASLAPRVLVTIVEPSQVLETLDDFFALMRFRYMTARSRFPNYYNFISGPSRTADIEQTLTIGVHGPGEVHMVLLPEETVAFET